VIGLVVRLARGRAFGAGDVVIQGVDDDSGAERRYRVQLGEADYNEAVRAHRNGLRVAVRGDLQVRGTRLSLHQIASFAVLPGLDDDDL
jgi:imidazolonepropionase-like amidohydrolase